MRILLLMILLNYTYTMTGIELATLMENRESPIDIKSNSIMVLTKKNGRVDTVKLMSISRDNSKKQMIRILEPAKDYRNAFLKIEKDNGNEDMWVYLEALGSDRKISSSKKSDSFIYGSDLSYEDMTNRDINEYEFKMIKDTVPCYIDKDEDCYLLSSKPKDKYTQYSEHKTWVTKDKHLAIKEESYDKNDKLLKTKKIKYKLVDKFHIMNELFVENVQKEHTTFLILNEISIDNGDKYGDVFFKRINLKRDWK